MFLAERNDKNYTYLEEQHELSEQLVLSDCIVIGNTSIFYVAQTRFRLLYANE